MHYFSPLCCWDEKIYIPLQKKQNYYEQIAGNIYQQ